MSVRSRAKPAFLNNDTGLTNTASGTYALFNNNGSVNTALGVKALVNNITENGNTAVANESNIIRLGQAPNQTRTLIAGITGVAVSGSQVVINSNGLLGIMPSLARYKRDVQDMGERSQGLLRLRPVTFRYKQDPQGQRQYGLIAEEVAKVYPELVVRGAKGEVESVQYHELIPMLLNEVQHQQRELAELKAQNEEQRAQNAALAARLEQLEAGAARTATLASH